MIRPPAGFSPGGEQWLEATCQPAGCLEMARRCCVCHTRAAFKT